MSTLRRIGIALGSFFAGWLCVGVVGGLLLALLGIPATSTTAVISAIVGLVLGGLINRDIMRRETRRETSFGG